jgi:ribosome-binding factor A
MVLKERRDFMKESNRKVDAQAREVLASILLFDVSDPRLDLVTITECQVSYDRAYCDVFYTTDPADYADVQAALARAKGFMRTAMAKKLAWRQAPELRFHLDETVDAAEKLGQYINAEQERRAVAQAHAEADEEL